MRRYLTKAKVVEISMQLLELLSTIVGALSPGAVVLVASETIEALSDEINDANAVNNNRMKIK